jgi:U3 small nucleolar RNA-associated protein 12
MGFEVKSTKLSISALVTLLTDNYFIPSRLGQKVADLFREKQEVTCLRTSTDQKFIAIGYIDGQVQIYQLDTKDLVCSLSLHRSAVTCLRYDSQSVQLLSGSLDTDIVISDMVAQKGQCRLSGHTGPITEAQFIESYSNVVVSCSKDTQVKFWDIDTHSCFKTIVDNRTEVWGLALMKSDKFLVTGSGDSVLRVYNLSASADTNQSAVEGETGTEESGPIACKFVGTIQRIGTGRTMNLQSDTAGDILGCHGKDDKIELFYFCTPEESLARLTKRMKKMSVSANSSRDVTLTDEVKRLPAIKTRNKIKSFDLLQSTGGSKLRICVSYANNLLQLYALNTAEKHAEPQMTRAIQQQGHHSEVRCLAFSSDNLAIASGSGDSIKLWNRESNACLRTVETDYVLAVCFVPGDRHLLAGLKSGQLLIVDISTGEVIETIPAHQKELWSICLMPDQRGFATGGGDGTVKTWAFELIDAEGGGGGKVLSVLHQQTLKVEETVLCVRIASNSKFIAVALLDSTVKIFFLDTFKFYLSLYGHKLPVLSMDISSDATLIATGSADRSVKVWGMDFGDCHRSILAHEDSVMGVQFVANTHQVFTCGKDGRVKQWDADTFEKILTLPGHLGEAYSLTVSPSGKVVASCGSDRTIRLFERTAEPIVLRDQQEEEREEIENRTLATGEETATPGLPGLNLPSRKTVGAENGAESILECLEVSEKFEESGANLADMPPLMMAYNCTTTDDFLLVILMKIRPSDLEEALLLLPFVTVCKILQKLPRLIRSRKDHTELIVKVVLFLFRVHQRPIVSQQTMLVDLQTMIGELQATVVEMRDQIGQNVAGLQLLQREVEQGQGVELFRDAVKSKKKNEKRARRNVAKRVYVQMAT